MLYLDKTDEQMCAHFYICVLIVIVTKAIINKFDDVHITIKSKHSLGKKIQFDLITTKICKPHHRSWHQLFYDTLLHDSSTGIAIKGWFRSRISIGNPFHKHYSSTRG